MSFPSIHKGSFSSASQTTSSTSGQSQRGAPERGSISSQRGRGSLNLTHEVVHELPGRRSESSSTIASLIARAREEAKGASGSPQLGVERTFKVSSRSTHSPFPPSSRNASPGLNRDGSNRSPYEASSGISRSHSNSDLVLSGGDLSQSQSPAVSPQPNRRSPDFNSGVHLSADWQALPPSRFGSLQRQLPQQQAVVEAPFDSLIVASNPSTPREPARNIEPRRSEGRISIDHIPKYSDSKGSLETSSPREFSGMRLEDWQQLLANYRKHPGRE